MKSTKNDRPTPTQFFFLKCETEKFIPKGGSGPRRGCVLFRIFIIYTGRDHIFRFIKRLFEKKTKLTLTEKLKYVALWHMTSQMMMILLFFLNNLYTWVLNHRKGHFNILHYLYRTHTRLFYNHIQITRFFQTLLTTYLFL